MKKSVLRRKICLLGDTAVGKTSLVRRFVFDEFSDDYISTVGAKVTKKDMNISIPKLECDFLLSLTIWDILGQISYMTLQSMFFKGASGAMIMSDLTRKSTLEGTVKWVEALFNVTGPIPVVFLANKSDLTDQYQFDPGELAPLCKRNGSKYYPTSAKTGQNVAKAFNHIAKLLINSYINKRA